MNPKFIDWLIDLRPGQWCMYANAYGQECNAECYRSYGIGLQTFQDFLMECFNREVGEQIQGENNE